MQKTANPNASAATKKLLNDLSETAGKAIITGQHTQTNTMEEINYIRKETGKEPLLRGFELLAYSPNINYQNAGRSGIHARYSTAITVPHTLGVLYDMVEGILHWRTV